MNEYYNENFNLLEHTTINKVYGKSSGNIPDFILIVEY